MKFPLTVRPTSRGLGFGILVVALYLFAGQTQIGWLYVMVAMGLAWLVLSLVVPLWAISALRIERAVTAPAGGLPVEDEPVEVRLRVDNTGQTTRRFVRLIDRCPLDAPDRPARTLVAARLPAGRTTDLTYQVTGYLRGVYRWPPLRVESAGPLGLFRFSRRLAIPTEVMVLPPVIAAMGTLAGVRREPAPAVRPRRGNGLDLYGTREYHHGDPIRQVHWRSTARHRALVVREFEEPRQPSLTIWIDNAVTYGRGRESTLEYAVKLATGLGVWALRAGYAVWLVDRITGTACRTPIQLRQSIARTVVAGPVAWPAPVEALRSGLAVALRPLGGPDGDPPIHPGLTKPVLVGLAGFTGQSADPTEPCPMIVYAGSDLTREVTRLISLVQQPDAVAGPGSRT